MPYSRCYAVSSWGDGSIQYGGETCIQVNASKIRQAVRVAGQNLLFRDCAENVQHGKDIDQNGAYECWLLFCHNRYVVKCQYDSLYESNGSLSQHGMDSEITLPRNSVYARKPHIRQYFRCSPTRIWRVVPGWEEVGLYHYRQRGQHRCSSQKVELAVAELLWSQFTFGSYKRNGKR